MLTSEVNNLPKRNFLERAVDWRNRFSTQSAERNGFLFERLNFRLIHGYPLDLYDPKSFSEKIIWKKLFDRNPILVRVADKHAVRDYIVEKLGERGREILIEQYWAGKDPESIPFDKLPSEYMVKANHGSRMNLVQSEQKPISPKQIISLAQRWLKTDFGVRRNEWCYSQIPRKIVIERLLRNEVGGVPNDVKIYMFGRKVGLILVIDRNQEKPRSAFFDENYQPVSVRKSHEYDASIKLPDNICEMLEIAKDLAEDLDHVRVDLYSHNGKIYFGELTNYSASGRVAFHPTSFDFELGRMWNQDKSFARSIGTYNFITPKYDGEKAPKVAITVQKYHHPGQTFVNRHIGKLFTGNTCVISERRYKPHPENAPQVFYLSDHIFNFSDTMVAPYMAWRNYRQHHGFRVPYGCTKQALANYLRQEGAQIILSEFGSQSMLVASLGQEIGLPVFCYFRGRDASFWLNNETRVRAYEKLFPSLAGVFAVSQYLLDNLASVGLRHANSHAVPSGTDIDLFKPTVKDPNLILTVGRFVKKKAPELNIKAFARIASEYPDARLEMIGDGPEMKNCSKLIKAEGLEGRVILHGNRDSQFVASRLSEASIFMQHSVIDPSGEAEGLPSSIQEAMSAGCAICSTDHAGINEIVSPGLNGYLSDEWDLDAYTKHLRLMLSQPEQTAQMGKESRRVAEDRLDYRKLYAYVEKIMKESLTSKP